jgi:hypothetical protein
MCVSDGGDAQGRGPDMARTADATIICESLGETTDAPIVSVA